jgi:WD40 repeat protein
MSEIATGSRDGCVKIWDTRQPEKAVLTIRSNSKRDIWAVAFGKDMYRKDETIY